MHVSNMDISLEGAHVGGAHEFSKQVLRLVVYFPFSAHAASQKMWIILPLIPFRRLPPGSPGQTGGLLRSPRGARGNS